MSCSIQGVEVLSSSSGRPVSYRVFGEVSGCERLIVSASCSGKPIEVPVSSGGISSWSVVFTNDLRCDCGSKVEVKVACQSGAPCSDVRTFELICDDCPKITAIQWSESGCVNGNRTITITFDVTLGSSGTLVGNWVLVQGTTVINGPTVFLTGANGSTVPSSSTIPNVPAGATYQVSFIVPSTSPDVECPFDDLKVDVSPCTPPACTMTVEVKLAPNSTGQAAVEGCAGLNAFGKVWLQASLLGTTAVPSQYDWTIEHSSSGQKATQSTSVPTVDPHSGWSGQLSNGGALTLNQSGLHTATVVVSFPSSSGVAHCHPSDTEAFTVPACTGSSDDPGDGPGDPEEPGDDPGDSPGDAPTEDPEDSTSEDGGCCICQILMILAMALIGLGIIALFTWACSGFLNVALLTTGLIAVVLGFIVLGIWMGICRNCPAIRFLQNMFATFSVIFIAIAVLLFAFGMGMCAVGALIVSAIFSVGSAILAMGATNLRCPR